jgi:hypothetical protein
VSADRRHPLHRIGRPKPKSPSLRHPSCLVRWSESCVGADNKNATPSRELGSSVKILRTGDPRDQGSLRPVRDSARKG